MFNRIGKAFGGNPSKRTLEEYGKLVEKVNVLEASFEALTDAQLRAKTDEFRRRLADGESLADIAAEAFAAVREASKRTVGLRHYDVQLIGGMALHQGKISEMRTGEGKTLVATLPIYLNALTGKGVHLVTVNDYLARRDARWMAPIYNALGLSVGVLQIGSRTENGKKAFRVDLEKESPHEDQHQLVLVDRRLAYEADITYGTNNEFGFDYLRDNMAMSLADRVQRGHHYAIVDEVDNVLIDEARTPLIISGPSHDDAENYIRMSAIVKQLKPEDYDINEKDRTASLTELGEVHVEQLLGATLRDIDRPEDITPEQARLRGFLEQAMRAQHLFKRNKDYLVQAGKVIIIDEFTGRLMPGRRWSDGLHQAVEAKEGVKVENENITYATITLQNYFRMYEKLAGMTGTALTEAEEFHKIYVLEVISIPTNLEYHALSAQSNLAEVRAKDESGYEYVYYAEGKNGDVPVFWKRKDYPDVVYRGRESKLRAMVREITQMHVLGRPTLVGTTSVESSDFLSSRLRAEPARRLLQTLLLRDTWFRKNNREEDGRMVMALSYLYEPLDQINPADMRTMARDLGLNLNLETEENLAQLLYLLGLDSDNAESRKRLLDVIKGGIPHQVLNARKHTEESQIIAGAGAYGAVTIATNMAGRGVDIKLGGEIAEEILTAINRVLKRNGYEKPYDLTLEERRDALVKLNASEYGIYESEVGFFLKSMEEMAKVKELGGLHVIGSERHEARRIDNQLRGRSARQGDPGSSRFYLSTQDDLMRLFAGQQLENMMQRLQWDDALPLEVKLVSRFIEGAQTRVEGANFDVRKHLLEYDDVLNSQRATVYAQRDRIFTKEDLGEDVLEMLEAEVARRVPEAAVDEEGPWKLLAWLEQIQPPLNLGGVIFPSFTHQMLLDHVMSQKPATNEAVKRALLEFVENSLRAEEEHVLRSAQTALEQTRERLESQLKEGMETLDTFIEGLRYTDETDTRTPAQLTEELGSLLRTPLRVSPQEQRLLREDPNQIADLVSGQFEAGLASQAVRRVTASIELRLNEPLELDPDQLAKQEWDEVSRAVLAAVENSFAKRRGRLLGGNGQLVRDLDGLFKDSQAAPTSGEVMRALMTLPQGERTLFDRKTHRQVKVVAARLTYFYYAAELLDNYSEEELSETVLKHLQNAQAGMQQAWGANVWERQAETPFAQLSAPQRKAVQRVLGSEPDGEMKLREIAPERRSELLLELGRQDFSETYRQLLLRVISELWIEYLTQVEGLRVSIGLEAYGQRDPLVQYKARASEMFQNLFNDMRTSVVNRMFTFLARPAVMPAASQTRPELAPAANGGNGAANAEEPETEEAEEAVAHEGNEGGKRKRRRKRR